MKKIIMKMFIRIACCVLAGVMMGFSANQLNTAVGCVCFTFGIALLLGSTMWMSMQDK